ncbi:MAG: hypothetical protein AAGC88_00420 [Bacteroidota bacterium]
MKLLLDENLPTKLKASFSSQHKVLTVKDQDWSGTKNGQLIRLMQESGFDGLITVDKNMQYQQNTDFLEMQLFVLNASNNKLSTLKPYVEKLEELLSDLPPERVILVEVGQ